ncbi:hypothetical protein FHS10_005661 [Mucilaginibacter dorajii]|uniref:Apea-like HEPN domain-containing protein n=2 Tax=Mucilaginibacter dorajii TaxID=692994 RepID=A0ABP7R879_9SPHI|nr:hypothetical protein [Mucilaginibacter dorajii]
MRAVKIEVMVPFYSAKMLQDYDTPTVVDVQNRSYGYNGRKATEAENMILTVNWDLHADEAYTTDLLVERGIAVLNYIIYNARTFDEASTNLVLIAPRTVSSAKVVVKDGDGLILNIDQPLHYEAPPAFQEYFYSINDEGWAIGFSEMMENASNQLLEINLLVDANHAIYEGRYSEAVINCATAVEAHTFPILSLWFKSGFLNPSDKNAENLLIDLSSATKLELLFGTIKAEYLSTHSKLLEALKGINRLRNKIIHQGGRASRQEAFLALDSAAKLIYILHFLVTPGDLDQADT